MRHLTAEGLVAFLRQNPLAKVLDVRFAHEREAHGHMPGDHHVPWHTLGMKPNPAFLEEALGRISPSDPVLVLCQNGDCSPHAAALLESAGFKHVYNVLGGYQGVSVLAGGPGAFAARQAFKGLD
jgi:rhodanese-related sulfurtransferase